MSAYITETEYKQLCGESNYRNVIQDDRTAGEASARFLVLAMRATRKVDSIIGMRYEIPLDTIPEDIKAQCASLINYYARLYVGTMRETDQKEYDITIEELKAYRNTTMELTDADGIVDEYHSKRVYSAGGNTKSSEKVNHINKHY